MASDLSVDRDELRALLTLGTNRGYLLLTEIHELHDPLQEPSDWPELVARAARDRGVEVVDDLTAADEVVAEPAGSPSTTTDGVRQYLNAIGRIALLTPEEEVDLAKRYRAGLEARLQLRTRSACFSARQRAELRRLVAGGDRAQERLVTANLRLVVSLSRRYLGRGLSLLELIQEGNLGLMRGVEKFDHTKGFKFSTYATWWIRQALTRGTASKARSVRLPVHVHELVAKLRRTEFELLQQLGREPTDEEVADTLGLTTDRIVELRLAGREVTSLDRPIGEDGETTIGELVLDDATPGPDEQAEVVLTRLQVAASLAELPDREREVLALRYGLDGTDPWTLEEIGARYGVTRERVRQIERATLAKLRQPAVAARLGDLEVVISSPPPES